MTEQRTILGIFAHPDDETFIMGGVACRYTAEGVRIGLVCATRGQHGKCGDPALCTPEELPARREQELADATRILGISDVHLLDYHDKRLAEAPPDEIRQSLVTVIRKLRPRVVITFDPQGVNLHSDHVAISRFASDAVTAAADPRWHPDAGEPHQIERLLWTTPRPVFALGDVPDPGAEPGVDFLFDIRPWADRKASALRAHRTQHLSIHRVFFSDSREPHTLRWEGFRQAFGPAVRGVSDDLFR